MSRSLEFAEPMQDEQVLENRQEKNLTDEDVALRAYLLWQEKGCPEGSAEEDWYEAKELLKLN
ncbi:MAG TPA: DUF2934 domain-containing protein [Bryobacteraceae bacterium]|jgi:hypothetical protein|nr:DUF2934 domain-containing protein [Bryobacteraceae bacterium]